MAREASILARVRKICLALPNTKETLTWGQPHFRVGEKIFAGCGPGPEWYSIGFKLEMSHAARRDRPSGIQVEGERERFGTVPGTKLVNSPGAPSARRVN
jgi:hypothetical protein